MSKTRLLTSVVLAGSLSLLAVSSASAQEWDNGYKSCSGVEGTVATKGYGTQSQKHTHNSTTMTFSYNSAWHWNHWNRGYETANWRIDTYGYLDQAVSGAYCA